MEADSIPEETMEQNKETPNEEDDDDLTQYDESMETTTTKNNENNATATTESAIQFSHFDSVAQDSVNDSNNMEDSATVAVATDTENSEVMDDSPDVLENEESAVDALPDSETIDLTEGTTEENNGDEEDGPTKLNQLPISKIRKIMKYGLGEDSEVRIITKEAAFLVGQATELFVAAIAQETAKITLSSKKKIMNMQHMTATICDSEVFAFLEGTMVPDYDF